MFEIEQFCADCREAMLEGDPARAVREVGTRAVSDPAALMRQIGEPVRAGLFPLHRSDDLTVINLIWGPGMSLPPHDHNMWAVIGIYTGREDNNFWRRSETDGLTKLGLTVMEARDCNFLSHTAIHSVVNPLGTLTGALHVYGGDFFAAERSEWDHETYTESPYDLEKNSKLFEDSNIRLEELQRRNP